MDISGVGSFPVQSGCSLTNFLIPFGVGKLALNRQNFYLYVLGVVLGFVLLSCKFVCPSVHPHVCQDICTSVIMFLHLSVHQYLSLGYC